LLAGPSIEAGARKLAEIRYHITNEILAFLGKKYEIRFIVIPE